jgi:hypothetical protein
VGCDKGCGATPKQSLPQQGRNGHKDTNKLSLCDLCGLAVKIVFIFGSFRSGAKGAAKCILQRHRNLTSPPEIRDSQAPYGCELVANFAQPFHVLFASAALSSSVLRFCRKRLGNCCRLPSQAVQLIQRPIQSELGSRGQPWRPVSREYPILRSNMDRRNSQTAVEAREFPADRFL